MSRANANLVAMRADAESVWVDRLLDDIRAAPAVEDRELTAVELRALRGYSVGLEAPEIAAVYGVSVEAVKSQTQRARRKLRAKTTTHAVALAINAGLLKAAQLREAVSPHSERTA